MVEHGRDEPGDPASTYVIATTVRRIAVVLGLHHQPRFFADRVVRRLAELADAGNGFPGAGGITTVTDLEVETPIAAVVAFERGIHPQLIRRGHAVVGEGVEHATRLVHRKI